jgi:hypothetical protein
VGDGVFLLGVHLRERLSRVLEDGVVAEPTLPARLDDGARDNTFEQLHREGRPTTIVALADLFVGGGAGALVGGLVLAPSLSVDGFGCRRKACTVTVGNDTPEGRRAVGLLAGQP